MDTETPKRKKKKDSPSPDPISRFTHSDSRSRRSRVRLDNDRRWPNSYTRIGTPVKIEDCFRVSLPESKFRPKMVGSWSKPLSEQRNLQSRNGYMTHQCMQFSFSKRLPDRSIDTDSQTNGGEVKMRRGETLSGNLVLGVDLNNPPLWTIEPWRDVDKGVSSPLRVRWGVLLPPIFCYKIW